MFRASASRLLARRNEARFSSSYSEHLRAVPFTRSLPEALQAYDKYHRSLISYRPSSSPDVKQSFLPFWAVAATASVQILNAEVGFHDSSISYRNGKPELVHETRWRLVNWSASSGPAWEQLHDPKQEAMQIYASYVYRRAYVNGLRGPGCFTGARRLTPELVELEGGAVAGLEEFLMRPRVALELAKQAAVDAAHAEAGRLLRQMFSANEVRNVNLLVTFERLLASPVYVPAFVFRSKYLGEEVRTFVHGSTLAVGGQRLYHPPVVAMIGGAAVAAALVFLTGSMPAGVVAAAGIVVGVMAVLYPLLALRIREAARSRDENRQATRGFFFGEAADDYVNAYGVWEAYARREEARWRAHEESRRRAYEEQRYYWEKQKEKAGGGGGSYTRASPDPKGYYKALGLQPGASIEEVKAAFKALALKHHPDRYTDKAQAEQAKQRFQKISAVYQVLKDPGRKNVYDETGRD